MMNERMKEEHYYLDLAVAYVRGALSLPDKPLNVLSLEEKEEIFFQGTQAGLKLHAFKKTMGLPRVKKILGAIKGLHPPNLLDIGGGRGVFLWSLLYQFPELPVTAVDKNPHWVNKMEWVRNGGFQNLTPCQMDALDLKLEDNSFFLVTALEVLEHILEVEKAVNEIVRVASDFVLVSAPSKEDTNPDHVHLLDKVRMQELFQGAGIINIRFEYVLNHLIGVARIK